MNWDAIGAMGEIVGALAVVATLTYLATQVRYAKQATADQNRLVRASGVREMALAAIQNDELRDSLDSNWQMNDIHEQLARENGTIKHKGNERSDHWVFDTAYVDVTTDFSLFGTDNTFLVGANYLDYSYDRFMAFHDGEYVPAGETVVKPEPMPGVPFQTVA